MLRDGLRIGRKEFEGSERQRILSEMVAVVILLVLLASVGRAGEQDYSAEDIFQFKTYYYLDPQPEKLIPMLQSFINLETITNGTLDEYNISAIPFFFGRATPPEPTIIAQYNQMFEEGTHIQRLLILNILQFCGNEDTKRFFETNLRAGRFGKEKTYIVEAIKEGIPVKYEPLNIPIDKPWDIDFLWTEFEVTGNEKIVKRVITALNREQDDKDLESLIRSAAKWSLVRNCKLHERALEICKRELSMTTGPMKERLEEAIVELDFPLSIEQLINEGLNQKPVTGVKGWALACAGVLWERNHDRHDIVSGRAIIERNIVDQKERLSKWWGVKSRKDLFETLEWIDSGGHRKGFAKMAETLGSLSQVEYRRFLQGYGKDKEKILEVLTVRKYYKELGDKGIFGWDYSRYICLCRWGYEVGYLREKEAWEMIMPVSRRLQATFDSWEDLGRNYLIGREYWDGDKKSTVMCEDAYQRLLDMPSSPWNKYPWDTDITLSEQNNSVAVPSKEK